MSVEDFRINAFVRQILSRSWVDLQPLSFGAAGRIVFFHGRFQKLRPPAPPDFSPWERNAAEEIAENLAALKAVEQQVRDDLNVTDVIFRLENFRKVQGEWVSSS